MEEIAAGNVEWIEAHRRRSRRRRRRRQEESARRRQARRQDAQPARRPPFVAPQLATLVEAPPAGDDWLHEIKFDGYRAIAARRRRQGVDLHPHRPRLDRQVPRRSSQPLADLPCRRGAARRRGGGARREGRSDFGALQDAHRRGQGRASSTTLSICCPSTARTCASCRWSSARSGCRSCCEDQPQSGPLFYSDHVVGHGARDLLPTPAR